MKGYLLLIVIILLISCENKNTTQYLGVPVSEIEESLNKHLNDWFPRVIDVENGGYYTNFEYNWEKSPDQQKMLVTQARDLWTASKAARLFPEQLQYKKAADHGFLFITQKMWDQHEGGFHLYFKTEAPDEVALYKLLYGNAFALFAFAEYAKINPSTEVYSWIIKLVSWMDEKAHDDQFGGFYNIVLSEKLLNNPDEMANIIGKIGWGDPEWKDQNTSIHLLEAFTTAYEVMPIPEIELRLKEMLTLVRDTMVNKNGSLNLYFTQNWKAIDYSDSSRTFVLDHQLIDHVSFGHNIETAYLLIDAAEKLYGKVDEHTLAVARELTHHTLKHGFAPDYYGLFDKGYVFNGNMEIINRNKTWWSQAEAWHTMALMAHYFPDEEQYTEAFRQLWKYMQNELYDHKHGGFYNNGLDESPENAKDRKAHNWKGPYHDGRALMNVWEYTKK
jgi:cellobiose epimerase